MARAKGRGRPRGSRGTGRGRGRPRKNPIIDSDEDHEQMETSDVEDKPADVSKEEESSSALDDTVEESVPEQTQTVSIKDNKDSSVEFNIDDDISQLVPPTFSTISKGPPQPMLELSWDHQYCPMGEKVASPNIHMCISCKLPIRLYGRLIPCKHVFCHACAVKQGDRCSCCDDRVIRVEKAPLGSVFMCLQGGIQFGYDGCRRTYLSQRDLQSHVDHRHKPRPSSGSGASSSVTPGGNKSSSSSSSVLNTSTTSVSEVQSPIQSCATSTPTSLSHRQTIPVHYSTSRSNLISVPLQSSPATAGGRPPNKDPQHPENRYERKPGSSTNYTRNSSTSGWGSFRPY